MGYADGLRSLPGYRQSFERPEPIRPGQVLLFTTGLHTRNYAFKMGRRIPVPVQSTWFPLIDRNPQGFVQNIFNAKAVDFRAAVRRIYRSGTQHRT